MSSSRYDAVPGITPEKGTPAVQEISIPTRSSSNIIEPSKVALKKGFSLAGMLWGVTHLIPLGMSAVLFSLNYSEHYWGDVYDEVEKPNSIWPTFKQTELLKALLFASKLHELLIIASLSKIVLHFARVKLTSRKGLPFGALTAGHRGLDFFATKGFWVTMQSDTKFALFTLFCTVLANICGPSSASLIIPTLNWWSAPLPYGGQPMPMYIGNGSELWPEVVSASDLSTNCFNSSIASGKSFCPSGGFSIIDNWAVAYRATGSTGNLSFAEPLGGARRYLNSHQLHLTNSYGNNTGGAAFTTGIGADLTRLFGLFWLYIQHNPLSFKHVSSMARPKFTLLSETSIKSPLVHVTCKAYSYREAISTVPPQPLYFPMPENIYSNLSQYSDYQGWPVESQHWNFSRPSTDVNFTFVDLWNWKKNGQNHSMSLGAVFTVPFVSKTETERFQESWIVPCTIDVRFLDIKLWYDPTSDDAISTNLTDPSIFAISEVSWRADRENDFETVRRRYGISDRVQITPNWASALDIPVPGVFRPAQVDEPPRQANMTMMRALVEHFTEREGNATHWEAFFRPPNLPSNYTLKQSQASVAYVMATILGAQLGDGLARRNVDPSVYLVRTGEVNFAEPDSHPNITDILLQTSEFAEISDEYLAKDLKTAHRFTISVERWGYGWAIKSAITIFAFVVLAIQATISIFYLSWMLYSSMAPGKWTEAAWGDIGDLFALALNSGPSPSMEGTSVGIDHARTWSRRVKVMEVTEGHLELVVGERLIHEGLEATEVIVGKRYS